MIEPTSLSAVPEVVEAPAFEEFFLAEHERLFQAFYLLTGDRYEADDLAQEALMRAYERWDRVGSMDSPVGYVYRTALNLHRSRLRRLAVRARRVFAAIPVEDAAGSSRPATTSGALARLPRGQREALVLIEWLGLGCEEAGRVLGIDASSVRGRLHRGRDSLRELLGDAMSDLRKILERGVGGATPPPDGFERMLRRRDRKRRNERITGGRRRHRGVRRGGVDRDERRGDRHATPTPLAPGTTGPTDTLSVETAPWVPATKSERLDYLIDVNTGETTALPGRIVRSLNPTFDLGRYAASPDGSTLAYVGLGNDGRPFGLRRGPRRNGDTPADARPNRGNVTGLVPGRNDDHLRERPRPPHRAVCSSSTSPPGRPRT